MAAAQHSFEGREQAREERGETWSHFALDGYKLSVFTHVTRPPIYGLFGLPSVVTFCVVAALNFARLACL